MFQPTALLVMAHNTTGLNYFCKTSRLNLLCQYKGSGIYWKRHLKKHGKDISIGVLGIYYDEQRCVDAAKEFSIANDIVASDRWANMINENGLDGQPSGKMHVMFGKVSPSKGQKRPWVGKSGKDNPMFGKPSAMRGIPKPKGKDSPLYGRKRPDGGGKPSVAVIATGVNGEKKKFTSLSEAGRFVGSGRHAIRAWCEKGKTMKNYVWEFEK